MTLVKTVKLLSAHNPDEVGVGGKHVHLKLLRQGLGNLGLSVMSGFLPIEKARLNQWDKLWIHRKNVVGRKIRFYEKMTRYFSRFEAKPGEIINAHDSLSAMRSKGPTVLTLHGYLANETLNYGNFSPEMAAQVSAYLNDIERKALERVDAVICVDSRIRDYVVDVFKTPIEKTHVIYNAIDSERFYPASKNEIKALRLKHGLEESAFILFCPRRLVKKNGVHIAVEAMRHLAEHDNVCLMVVGDGPELANITALAEPFGPRIKVLPAVHHEVIADYYRMADVILVPSITSDDVQEATSLSMLEGLSCAKPVICSVICSAIGGMKEVLEKANIGYLVPEQDPAALASTILWIRENTEQVLQKGMAARTYIETHHAYQQHAKQFLHVYEHVLETRLLGVAR